jgi:hypothetical protein
MFSASSASAGDTAWWYNRVLEANFNTGSMNAFTAQAQVLQTRTQNVDTCRSAAHGTASANQTQELVAAQDFAIRVRVASWQQPGMQ